MLILLGAEVQPLTPSKAEGTLTTNYTAYADAARAAAVSTSSADVRNYSYAKSATDSAIAAAESRLRSEFVGSGGATEAYVTNYAYSKSQIDQSEALQSSVLTTNYQAYGDSSRDQAVSTSNSYTQTYAYSKSGTDGAISSLATTLRSEFSNSAGVTASYVQNYAYSKAETNAAIATSTQTLSTTVDGHTSTLQLQGNSINGLSTQYTVKSDINGYITGYGLASTANNGSPSSIFIINAGAFSVVAPGAAPKTMFTVGLVNGVAQMVLRGDALFDGAITARALKIGSFDNIVPDPKFYDLGWWGRTGNAVGQWADAGQATGWLGGASMYLGPADDVEHSSDTPYFPIERGATYKITFQVALSSDFVGQLSVYWLFPGEAWWALRGGYDGGAGYDFSLGVWADGLPVHFNTNSPKGLQTFVTTLRAADVQQNVRSLIRVRNKHNSGTCELGAISITRMSDNTLITDDGVTTPKLATNAVIARHIASDEVLARHLKSDIVEARHLKSDIVQAKHMTADSVVTDSIIANGISSIDRVFTTSYTFTSVRNFKLDLTVTQDGTYNAESGVISGGWVLEKYTDQGAGQGYWQIIVETFRGGLYSDTIELGATSSTYPYYRISAKSGTGPFLAVIWKVFK